MSKVPLPLGNDWKTWGRQLTTFLGQAIPNLAHKTAQDSPAQNGTLLWDETLKDAVVSVDGEWRPVSMDFDVYLAEQIIQDTYGDRVSVMTKKKTLSKFGHSVSVGTASTRYTIWDSGHLQANETYVTTDAIDTISSTDAADTSVINIEGHTVTGTGSSAQFTFVTQSATLNGQNKVVLTTPLARVSRAYVDNGGTVAGDVSVYEDTAISGGIPTDTTKVHLSLRGTHDETQSFKGATTLSNVDYGIVTGGYAALSDKTAATADLQFEVRRAGGTFRPLNGKVVVNSVGSTTVQITFKPYGIIPKNSDVRITAKADASNTEIDASFSMYLAKVIS